MTQLITQSVPVPSPGSVLLQTVNFSGERTINKVSLDVTVFRNNARDSIIEEDGVISFQAANWQKGRNTWVFQPEMHWDDANDWQTSGTTIRNTLQYDNYSSATDAQINAPYLEYELLIEEEGTYDLWGYGYTLDSIYWSWDDQPMETLILSDIGKPKWTFFGTVIATEPNKYSFKIFLNTTNIVLLDQWYFTKNTEFSTYLDETEDGYLTPLSLSKCPFNTAVRLRSLYNESVDDLENPYLSASQSITAWLPKVSISGKYNYLIQNTTDLTGIVFENGLSIEYWQIGGDTEFFSAWDYIFTNNSIGTSLSSTNYGQNFS